MREFNITPKIKIIANYVKARDGFNHTATLFVNGSERETVKVHYINRTWELYEFQSVMQKLIDKTTALSEAEKKMCRAWLEQSHTDWSDFKMTSQIAMLGDVFGQTPKEKSDWKVRMLKAGLGSKGLDIPEDFDTLPEEVRTARLEGVMKILKDTPKSDITAFPKKLHKIKNPNEKDIIKEVME